MPQTLTEQLTQLYQDLQTAGAPSVLNLEERDPTSGSSDESSAILTKRVSAGDWQRRRGGDGASHRGHGGYHRERVAHYPGGCLPCELGTAPWFGVAFVCRQPTG